MRRLAVWIVLVASLALSARAEKPPHKLKLDPDGSRVTVGKATPGGRVLLIGYEQTTRDYSRVFRRVEKEGVADDKGELRFELGRPIAPRSFWLAVDLMTTGYGAVTADGKKLREGEILPGAFRMKGSRRERAIVRFDYVRVLVVRAQSGVWELTSSDGGPLDADEVLDGEIDLDVRKFARRGDGSTSLDEYRDGDLVIVFVPREMGYVVTVVGR